MGSDREGNPPLSRRYGWTREEFYVSLSQSVKRPQIFVGQLIIIKIENLQIHDKKR